MVNVFLEKDSQEVFLHIWLGGVLETEQGESIFIKHPSNVLAGLGYICLDGVIDSSKWHGWLLLLNQQIKKAG